MGGFYGQIPGSAPPSEPTLGEITLAELAHATADPRLGRAARAEALLSDSLFDEAVEAVGASYTRIWERSAPNDKEARELAYQRRCALDDVVRLLQHYLRTGQLIRDGNQPSPRRAV